MRLAFLLRRIGQIVVTKEMPRSLFTLLAILMLTIGCASETGMSRAQYDQRLKGVEIGMSKSDLITIFPDASPRGAKKYQAGTVEVLEIGVDQYSFMPTRRATSRNSWTGVESHPRWFYFLNDRLIQYGEPNDWPDADVVVKVL